MKITVSELDRNDRKQWETLYYEYAEFYNMPMDQGILDTIWSWVFDQNTKFFALIAKDESDQALGLMHFRAMPSPLRGAEVGFLDDLYVKPAARGMGVVDALYQALNEFGQKHGWPFIRWITADNNYRGRAVYDKIAEKTHWLTYQMPIK
jgi:ribosomal protein S18 acetylase RimI-like enzyme